jgi:hypothetical protein
MIALAVFLVALPAVVLRPSLAAYLFLLINPLIVGVARDALMPVLRPNELLLLVLLTAIGVRVVLLMLSRTYHPPPFDRMDIAFVLLAVTGSLLPLALRYVRSSPVTSDDILYAIVLWKYFALYRLIRSVVLTPAEVERCAQLSMISAAVVAVIAILQVSGLFGVPEFLHTHYDQPFEAHTGLMMTRGTSTIASSFGVADMMMMNLVLALALLATGRRSLWLLLAAGLFLSGCVAAGALSGYIGLIVALVTFGVVTGRLASLLPAATAGIAAAVVLLWPVIQGRLAGFQNPSGLPPSWTGRWENLETYFLPEIFSGLNWLVGVRPAARLPASETWREWIYIESGYVWLLWIGGLPFLAAFGFFVLTACQQLLWVARERNDAVGAAATASLSYLVVIVVLMLFDPHLTVRGSADLFFPLLALGAVASALPRNEALRLLPAQSLTCRLAPGRPEADTHARA